MKKLFVAIVAIMATIHANAQIEEGN
jgi:hypothetical protein